MNESKCQEGKASLPSVWGLISRKGGGGVYQKKNNGAGSSNRERGDSLFCDGDDS